MRTAIFLLGLAACGNNDANNKHPLLDGMPALVDSGGGSGTTCGRTLAPDGARHVVVSRRPLFDRSARR